MVGVRVPRGPRRAGRGAGGAPGRAAGGEEGAQGPLERAADPAGAARRGWAAGRTRARADGGGAARLALAAPSPPPSGPPAAAPKADVDGIVSPRQREVLELVAEGL